MFFFGNSIPSCNVNQAKEIMDQNSDCLILDVRTPEEYSQAHIPGSKLVPLNILGGKINELNKFKDKEVLVICRSGNRSMSATSMLINQGFTKAKNVQGGIISWYQAGHPVKGQ